MSKKYAYKMAKNAFSELKPEICAAFSLHKKCLVLAGTGNESIVIYNKDDVLRLKGLVDLLIMDYEYGC